LIRQEHGCQVPIHQRHECQTRRLGHLLRVSIVVARLHDVPTDGKDDTGYAVEDLPMLTCRLRLGIPIFLLLGLSRLGGVCMQSIRDDLIVRLCVCA
jgi:hypothetical protein